MEGKGDGSVLIRKGTGDGSLVTGCLSESLPRTAQQPSGLLRGGLLLKEVADAKEPKVIPVGRGGIRTGLRTPGQLGATLPAA